MAEFIKILERIEDCDIIYTGFKTFTAETRSQLFSENIDIKEEIEDRDSFFQRVFLNECMNSVWRCLFKTEIAKTVSFNQLRFAEDLFYVLEYAQKITKAVYTTAATYFYRIDNPNSMLRNEKNIKYLKEYKMIPVLVSRLMDKYSLSNAVYREKMTSEYALAVDRIRSMVSFSEFVDIVDNQEFRVGLNKIVWNGKEKKKSVYAYIIRYRLYYLFKIEDLWNKIYWRIKGCLQRKK